MTDAFMLLHKLMLGEGRDVTSKTYTNLKKEAGDIMDMSLTRS